MLSRKEMASKDQLPIRSKQSTVIKDKDRSQITDITWAVKGDIFRTREIGVDLRGLTRLRRRVRMLKERCLRR